MGRSKWALLIVLLGMMVAMGGCFGGGPIRTGGLEGTVCVPTGDNASPPIDILKKGLALPPPGCRFLEGADVKVAGRTSKTNSIGYFEIWDIPEGRHKLEIAHKNYQPYSTWVRVYADDLTYVDDSPVKLGIGYYLLIGVGTSKFTATPSLGDGPRNDVGTMELALAKDDLWLGDYTVLIDEDATFGAVEAAVRDLIGQMNENDFLVIYFSGHGIGGTKSKLEVDALLLFDDMLIDVELEKWIRESRLNPNTNKVTLILDACNSGSFADGETRYPEEFGLKAFQQPRYTVLASSSPEQSSEQYPYGKTYGVFTYHLVNGFLSDLGDLNQDGKITAAEARKYVDEQVAKEGLSQRVYLYPWGSDTRIFQYKR